METESVKCFQKETEKLIFRHSACACNHDEARNVERFAADARIEATLLDGGVYQYCAIGAAHSNHCTCHSQKKNSGAFAPEF